MYKIYAVCIAKEYIEAKAFLPEYDFFHERKLDNSALKDYNNWESIERPMFLKFVYSSSEEKAVAAVAEEIGIAEEVLTGICVDTFECQNIHNRVAYEMAEEKVKADMADWFGYKTEKEISERLGFEDYSSMIEYFTNKYLSQQSEFTHEALLNVVKQRLSQKEIT